MNNMMRALRLHRPLLVFGWGYAALVIVMALAFGAKPAAFAAILSYFVPAALTSFFFPGLILLFYLGRAAILAKRDTSWLRVVTETFDRDAAAYWRSGRAHNGFTAMLALFPVLSFFCIGKSLIRHILPYYLDPALTDLDRLIHFGYYPHEYLLPLIEHSGLTQAMDNLYLSWFIIVYLVSEFCSWADTDTTRRLRFLWAYSLSWIVIGNLMALALSSVGPIYYHEFFSGPDPYGGLLSILHSHGDLKLFGIAADLLEMAHNDKVININAISAMPSLHVAIAALLFLYFRSINKAAWIFLILYFFLILAGSVYLGWHYAVDGYIGTGAAWILWRLTAHIKRKE